MSCSPTPGMASNILLKNLLLYFKSYRISEYRKMNFIPTKNCLRNSIRSDELYRVEKKKHGDSRISMKKPQNLRLSILKEENPL